MLYEDQAAGLRRLMTGALARPIAVLEPGRDSGAVALVLASALAEQGTPTLAARLGRRRAYRHAQGSLPTPCVLPADAFADLPRAVRDACALPVEVALVSAQAETWSEQPAGVRQAEAVLMVVHAQQDPVEALAWVYASVKALLASRAGARMWIAVRAAPDAAQAEAVYRRVADVAAQYLGARPAWAGALPAQVAADDAQLGALARTLASL